VDKASPNGKNYRGMLLALAKASGEFNRLASRFGLTTVDRTRVGVPGAKKDERRGVPSRNRKDGPPPPPDAG
jgi:hypothetical protein